MTAGFKNAAAAQIAVDSDGSADLGPAGSLGDRDRGVGRLERFALPRQGRIGLIGGDERLAQGIRTGRAGHQGSDQRCDEELTDHGPTS